VIGVLSFRGGLEKLEKRVGDTSNRRSKIEKIQGRGCYPTKRRRMKRFEKRVVRCVGVSQCSMRSEWSSDCVGSMRED